jgi:rhodanese-related sulfurtransferase
MKTIHPLDLDAKIQAHEPIEILDLRSRAQFEKRHLHGSHSLPFDEFDLASFIHCRELPLADPLYLVSQKGGLARLVGDAMKHRGFDNLIVVEGGLENWTLNGLAVDRLPGAGTWLLEQSRRMLHMGVVTELRAIGVHP